MKKDGILILSQGVLPSDTRTEPEHTHVYGGESAFLALLLSRLAVNTHLMICDTGDLTNSLERTFRENMIHWTFFPSQQSVDLSMSFGVASGSFGGSPMATSTVIPLKGSLFMQESFNEEYKEQNYIVIPSHLLESEIGREVAMASVRLSEQNKTKLAFFGGSCPEMASPDAQSMWEEIMPHLDFLSITALDCEFLFGKKVETVKDCTFLRALNLPLIWVDLGEHGNLMIDHGRFQRFPFTASPAQKRGLPLSLLRQVFFTGFLWRLNEHKGSNLYSRSQLSDYINFARNIVSILPDTFSTPFDLPTHEDAKQAMSKPWWRFW